MLSNPPTTSNLHANRQQHRQRQRQHRRQNSTPSAFETVKIQSLTNVRPAVGHRRGLSLDIRRQSTSPTMSGQDIATVSIPTNQGLADTSQHHALREAQQQRLLARPGPQQMHGLSMLDDHNSNHESSYLISPHNTPHAQRFDPACFDSGPIPFDSFGGHANAMAQKTLAGFATNMPTKDYELFAPDSALSTPTFVTFHDSPATAQGWISEGDTASTRRTSRRISNGIMDRVVKFESLGGVDGGQRPMTPPNQNANNYFPPTPMETPQEPMSKMDREPRPTRFSDGYDESMEETIKPPRARGLPRPHNVFEEMRHQAEQVAIPTPPRTNQMPDFKMYDTVPVQVPADYMDMNNFNAEFMKIQDPYENMDCSGEGLEASADLSQHSAPDTPHLNQFRGSFDLRTDLRPPDSTSPQGSPTRSQGPSRRGSPHRRTESLASIASAASIASINIEETKTETGVTTDDIAAYIQGPDPVDNKWVCLYEGCNKKFGRKENIKSHVQTHLNDRQYQCPTCRKCFVRQHDLKRHAKIHTGIKPYPCECGNSFARHDALTRHRQRGMCIGAFDGIVRKVVKRGRPRKHRPDMESRLDKSARTRKKNLSISSVSSQSGYSDSSVPNSPHNGLDMLDGGDFDLMEMAMDHGPLAGGNVLSASTAPMPSIATDAHLVDFAHSPAPADSPHSYVSPEAVMDPPPSLPKHPPSPAKSVASQYNTPPELSHSSSPPPCNRLFDLEHSTSGCADDSLLAGVGRSAAGNGRSLSGTLAIGITEADDDMLIRAFTNDDGLVQLDRDPSLLLMSKFDDDFDSTVSMFTSGDDMFFGGS